MVESRRVYFPLASNAYSLLTGSPLESVRRRIKMASLLHDEVYLQSGSMQIQAGATGASAMQNRNSDEDIGWQTPRHRASLQSSEFTVAIAPEGTPSGSVAFREMMRSRSVIAWYPTFEPFRRELPDSASWIEVGQFDAPTAEEKARGRSWRSRDSSNAVLLDTLPDALVRNQVLGGVQNDLILAHSRGVGLSIDRLHATVLSSRLTDPRAEVRDFALPILVPRAGNLSWEDVAGMRRHKSMVSLRRVLLDIEAEVLEHVNSAGEIPAAVKRAYRTRIERFALDTPSVGSAVGVGIAEIAVGGAIGFATAGIGWIGAAVGAVPGVSLTAWDAIGRARAKRSRTWISALQEVESKAD